MVGQLAKRMDFRDVVEFGQSVREVRQRAKDGLDFGVLEFDWHSVGSSYVENLPHPLSSEGGRRAG